MFQPNRRPAGPRRPSDRHERLAQYGGQHRAPIGTSTRDISDQQDQQERLADFEAALEQARFGCVSGREW